MKNTEVELRGPLKPGDKERVEEYLRNAGATPVSYHDLGIFFNADQVQSFGSFSSGSARLQVNQKTHPDGKIEQVAKMKLGNPTGTEREEYEISLKDNSLRNFLELLKRFGITQATFRGCERSDYTFHPFAISLKTNHAIGDHFEVEMMNGREEDVLEFLSKLELTAWTPEEFKEVVMESRHRDPYKDFEEGLKHFNI